MNSRDAEIMQLGIPTGFPTNGMFERPELSAPSVLTYQNAPPECTPEPTRSLIADKRPYCLELQACAGAG
jgi:hypothetical protein